eukprot:scaffold5798_cov173-Amphora_coffeaeformis.AAC.2
MSVATAALYASELKSSPMWIAFLLLSRALLILKNPLLLLQTKDQYTSMVVPRVWIGWGWYSSTIPVPYTCCQWTNPSFVLCEKKSILTWGHRDR